MHSVSRTVVDSLLFVTNRVDGAGTRCAESSHRSETEGEQHGDVWRTEQVRRDAREGVDRHLPVPVRRGPWVAYGVARRKDNKHKIVEYQLRLTTTGDISGLRAQHRQGRAGRRGWLWSTALATWWRPVGVQRGIRAPGSSAHPPSWLTAVG